MNSKLDDPNNPEWWFTFGVGNINIQPFKTVATADNRLNRGDILIIEQYQSLGTFEVTDSGTWLEPNQLDVFVGETTYAQVHSYSAFFSRVGLVS